MSPNGEKFSEGTLLFEAFDRTFRLVLHETDHLIHENFTTHHHEAVEDSTKHRIVENSPGIKVSAFGCYNVQMNTIILIPECIHFDEQLSTWI